jgi:hypothetical protein
MTEQRALEIIYLSVLEDLITPDKGCDWKVENGIYSSTVGGKPIKCYTNNNIGRAIWVFGRTNGIQGVGATIRDAIADFRRQVREEAVLVGAIPAPDRDTNTVSGAPGTR